MAFSALADMVRMRARIADDDATHVAAGKLAETLAAFVPDLEERAFLEPRLGHLLGLADRSAPDREDLFSAWRLFVERMSEQNPVVLVFEDLHWADLSLLDFVDYLLEWSRAFPIFVLTLARPDLAERRPTFGIGQRDYTSLVLEPLAAPKIEELLSGLAPGLPDDLRARIGGRAEGVPLYAVETVRMLLDRGALARSGDEFRLTGPLEALDVPETLHALVAARLDGLDPAERRLLEDAAVLGETFTRAGLTALSGLRDAELDSLLQALLRKEVLKIQNDPLSPERGQLSFVQDLIRRVAYETLSLQERKRRHLAAAAHLGDGDDEIAAVLAAHFLAAYRAGPGDGDAAALKDKARDALARAGERTMSLAAAGEASRYFAQAAELADEAQAKAELLERTGRAATVSNRNEEAHAAFAEARALLAEIGDRRLLARVEARHADLLRLEGRIAEALELMETAYDALAGEASPGLALVAAQLARVAYFAGQPERALEAAEAALDLAEAFDLPEPLAEALNTKGCLLYTRPHEAEALLSASLKVAFEHDLTAAVLRAQFNLSGLAIEYDRFRDAQAILEDSLVLARKRGDRSSEAINLGQLSEALAGLGQWDDALALLPEEIENMSLLAVSGGVATRTRIALARGSAAEARALLEQRTALRSSTDLQDVGIYMMCDAAVLRAEGRHREAFRTAERCMEIWRNALQFHYVAEATVEAAEALLELDLDEAEEFLEQLGAVPRIERRPVFDAQELRLRATLAARRGAVADELWQAALTRFRELEMPFWIAVTLLGYAEALFAADRPDEGTPLLSDSRELFSLLGAATWLERASTVAPTLAATLSR